MKAYTELSPLSIKSNLITSYATGGILPSIPEGFITINRVKEQ